MKRSSFLILFLFLSLSGISQLKNDVSDFLLNLESDYTPNDLDADFQFYRQLKTLRNTSNWIKEVELVSKVTHSNKNSYHKTRRQKIQFYAFQYEDNEKCDTAFTKLKSCFPNDCIKIQEGEDKTHKITPSLFIINAESIICIRIACEDFNEKWTDIVLKTVQKFTNAHSKIILTKCRKLTWISTEYERSNHHLFKFIAQLI